jgi:hypothetical protein
MYASGIKTSYMEIYTLVNGVKTGPYTIEQARSMVASGILKPADSVWHEGLSTWLNVSECGMLNETAALANLGQDLKDLGTEIASGRGKGARMFVMGLISGQILIGVILYLWSEWLRGRIQPGQAAGWFRGLVDGALGPAVVHGIKQLNGTGHKVYWDGATTTGYTLFFWSALFGTGWTLWSIVLYARSSKQ